MRNKFVSALTAIMLSFVLCLSGCSLGTYYEKGADKPTIDNGTPDDPNGGENPNPPVTSTHYTVTVFYDNKPFAPADYEITVVWQNDNNVARSLLDENGKADAGELDGDFNVYLVGLPDTFTYDPNGYKATSDERQISVLLTSVLTPSVGNGSSMYVNLGCYQTRREGTYRAHIARENQSLYYEFQPEGAGVYAFESWVGVYEDQINPYIEIYGGSSSFKWFVRKLDGGGASLEGGFTKNFRWEVAVSQSEVGNSFTFAVGGESKSQTYPLYVDFAITWIGNYTSDYNDVRPQSAKEARGKTPEPKEGQTFVAADLGTKVFDANRFKKSPNTGRYHVYDTELYGDNPLGYGKGYGPMLLCAITKPIEAYGVVPSLYRANSVGPNGSNYLMLYNTWIEEEQKFATFDYTSFIRNDYYRVCNSDGVCYVTDELIVFLQKFAENHSLYTDGVSPVVDTPEFNGYTANQDSLWLFACGIYE